MKTIGRRTALALTGATLAGPAIAQTYPDRPIRMIVPAGAGGPTDVVGRLLQPREGAPA